MSTKTQGQFPSTLVLPFTTLQSESGCSAGITANIQQGNTFSVPFDMTQAPHAPGDNGLVFLETSPQSNFQAAQRVQMSNEGLSDKIGFMSISSTPATIFGEKVVVTRIFLLGTPNGDVFTWETGVMLDNGCIITNGRSDDSDLVAKLQESAAAEA